MTIDEKKEGLLFKFHESRKDKFIEYVKINKIQTNKIKNFSDAFDILDWKVKDKEIAIISFSSKTLDYIALATKKQKVVTQKNKIEFSNILDLNQIHINEIEKNLHFSIKPLFVNQDKIEQEKLLSQTLSLLLERIKEHRKYLTRDIDRLITLQKYSNYTFIGQKAEQLSIEREAVGTVLDIFDPSTKKRQEVLSEWSTNEKNIHTTSLEKKEATIDSDENFLDGIKNDRTIQEETILQHDLYNINDYIQKEKEGGLASFTMGDRRLDIIYTNRTNIEKSVGVDLIYYQERYKLFILVQYKLLKEEIENDFIYRPDKQMREELKRMNDFMSKYSSSNDIKKNEDYRLNDDGFIFKFVENKGIKMTSSELTKGLYITREYMNFIDSDKSRKGKNGGTIISRTMTPRYLTNSEFTMLMNGGFLGTRGIQSKVLKDLIKSFFRTGKAVLLAIETDSKQRKIR